MTQTNVSVDRLAEFKALFLGLDEIGQEAAIIILKSLEFAQSVVINSQKLLWNTRNRQYFYFASNRKTIILSNHAGPNGKVILQKNHKKVYAIIVGNITFFFRDMFKQDIV